VMDSSSTMLMFHFDSYPVEVLFVKMEYEKMIQARFQHHT
jgi:hypothetical protein